MAELMSYSSPGRSWAMISINVLCCEQLLSICTLGSTVTFSVTATGTPTPYISLTAGSAPGVSFSPGYGTGTLYGTPTVTGTYYLTFTASSTAGCIQA